MFIFMFCKICELNTEREIVHSMIRAGLNKSEKLVTNTTEASKPKRPSISINQNIPFRPHFLTFLKTDFLMK